MKNPKAPNKHQKIAMQEYGLNTQNWLVTKANGNHYTLVHRDTGRVKQILK